MNKNSNTYIIIYATVMVVVVALVLAFASLSLQPRQKANADNETKSAILLSIGQGQEAAKAKDKTAYINEEYSKYITESFAVNYKGDRVEGADAFALLGNLKAEYAKPEADRVLPVFVGKNSKGNTLYVFPLYGSGLWGPIWGYLALESDMSTIFGAVFAHQGETPGLGAEIATSGFQSQFKGKSILSGDEIVGIQVLKGAGSSSGNPNAVDAISGGTITSRGVQDMITSNLKDYAGYIEKQKSGAVVASPSLGERETNLTGGASPDLPVVDNEPLTVDENE